MSSDGTHMDRAASSILLFECFYFDNADDQSLNHYFHSLFSCYVNQKQKGGDLKYLLCCFYRLK